MRTLQAILTGLAFAVVAAGTAAGQDVAGQENARRSAYSYVRETEGAVTVVSRSNGRVEARRNLPISAGDEIEVSEGGRAEVALADGNALFVEGGARARFASLHDQQGEEDQFSSINLLEGSVVLAGFGDNGDQIPRVDTEDATVYLNPGAQVRVNTDSRRGTVAIGRAGTAEVRTRAGTFRLQAGEYLVMRGDEEPQVERGGFSRDRFDLWVADRVQTLTGTRSVSARYTDDQYGSDVVALDGNGDWQYNDEYGADVWSPRVDAGWSPYSNGSWYYTPAGLTWWSYDPWGWFPFHYGSWFFSAGWNRWCWAPGSVFSPAWVYWGFTPSWVGWCPIGFFSPWFDNFFFDRRFAFINNFNRVNAFISINNVFSTRTVNFRGWNFVGANNFGAALSRMDVIPGSRIGERLGSTQIAVSSRPIVVRAQPGQAREAVKAFAREAPRVIERASSPTDSARLAPILARQRTLPQATLEAVAQHAVVAERGRLAGPGVADVAPRGALVEHNRPLAEIAREPAAGSAREAPARGHMSPPSAADHERAPSGERRSLPRPETDWRARPVEPHARQSVSPELARPDREIARPDRESAPADWRSRSRSVPPSPEASPGPRPEGTRGDSWRSRSEIPPARRVIEGAVPGRRAPEAPPEEARARGWRSRERDSISIPPARESRPEPRPEYRQREYRESAPPHESRREPRPEYRQREYRESAPPHESRREPRPEYRQREYRESAPPREFRPEPRPEYRAPRDSRPQSAPPARMERPPAYSAPPRAEVHQSAPRPPSSDRGRRDH